MLRDKDIATIREAQEIYLSLQFAHLRYLDGAVFEDVPRDLDRPVDMSPLKYFACLPVILVLVGIMWFLCGLLWICHCWDTFWGRREVKRLIREARTQEIGRDRRDLETLNGLWRARPGASGNLDDDEKTLAAWLPLLYGYHVARAVDIDRHATEIGERRWRANRDYYARVPGAPHFCFGPIMNCVVDRISEELGPWVRDDALGHP